jgi:CheY-like chemotaxis protein
VLLVDDNADALEALAELLRDYGHDVWTAHDARSAIDQASQRRPDVVLLDIGLPDIDGYELARRLREDLGLQGALFVALTGYGEARHRQLAREAGFDHHVTKPIDVKKLEELFKIPL